MEALRSLPCALSLEERLAKELRRPGWKRPGIKSLRSSVPQACISDRCRVSETIEAFAPCSGDARRVCYPLFLQSVVPESLEASKREHGTASERLAMTQSGSRWLAAIWDKSDGRCGRAHCSGPTSRTRWLDSGLAGRLAARISHISFHLGISTSWWAGSRGSRSTRCVEIWRHRRLRSSPFQIFFEGFWRSFLGS